MNEFVPTIRNDRYREINVYKAKNFSFIDEHKYELIDVLSINVEHDIKYKFEVRVNFNEVRFFIIKKGSSIYLSMYQLYELFYQQMFKSNKDDILFHLNQLLTPQQKNIFIYKGIEYKLTEIENFNSNQIVEIPNSGLNITLTELFYLLVLIQEKSNYFCNLSKTNKKYSNGLIRLLIALLKTEKDNKLLMQLGWFKNKDDNKFEQNTLQKTKNDLKQNKIVNRKYYLTEKELNSIIRE